MQKREYKHWMKFMDGMNTAFNELLECEREGIESDTIEEHKMYEDIVYEYIKFTMKIWNFLRPYKEKYGLDCLKGGR